MAAWRLRCRAQVEQLGICLLRDVYSLEPAGRDNDHSSLGCAFQLTEGARAACGAPFYVTDSCLVMCRGQFYDPCRCHPGSCDAALFHHD